MSRVKRPYGFEVWECWADALGWPSSLKRDMAWWMYREVFTGVRVMVKFVDLDNDDDWYEEMLIRHDIARGLGLETMLCIDWFNRANNASGYHSKLERPRLEDITGKVAAIIRDFSPTMIEVCNEPYYAKRLVDRVNHKEYRDFVQAYVDGAVMSNFDGKIVASQPNEKFSKPGDLHDAWVWDVHWRHGFIEGDHSAVLHECADIDCLTSMVDDWQGGKPIGYQYAHFETEFSACGRATAATDPHAEIITRQFVQWAKSKKLPFTWLDMGGYVPGGGWNMDTRLIDNAGHLTYAAKGLLSAMCIEPPYNPPPPEPPSPGSEEPGAKWFYRAARRAGQLPNVKTAGKDRRFNKYVRKFKESV